MLPITTAHTVALTHSLTLPPFLPPSLPPSPQELMGKLEQLEVVMTQRQKEVGTQISESQRFSLPSPHLGGNDGCNGERKEVKILT